MKFTARLIAAVLLPLLLASCDKTPVPPLVFGASVWPGYEPVYLAREQGYFSAVNLRLAEQGNAAEVKQAFRKHELHLAAITLDEALLLRRDIPDLKIILLLDTRAADKMLDVMVVRDDDIGKYHREIIELVRGWQRALEYMRTQPDKAGQAMAAREKVTPEQFAKAMQGVELLGLQRNSDLLIGEPPAVGVSVEVVQRSLMERGLINMGADTATLLDTGLLTEAMK